MFFKSIVFKISLIASVSLLLSFAVLHFLNLRQAAKDLTENIQSEQLSVAELIAKEIDNDITRRMERIKSVSTLISEVLQSSPAELKYWVKEQPYFERYFKQDLILVHPDGNIVAARPDIDENAELNFGDSMWFRLALESREVIVSTVTVGKLSHRPMVVLAASIRDESGAVLGVLATPVFLDESDLLAIDRVVDLSIASSALIIARKEKLFILGPDPKQLLLETPNPGENPLHDKAMAGFRGVGTTINAGGIEELSAIATVNTLDWIVVIRIPVEIAFLPIKKLNNTTWTMFAIVSCTSVLLVCLALLFFFRPLRNSSRMVREMAEGKRELAKLPNHQDDEIGDILESFNSLVKTIEEQKKQLKIANAGLAEKQKSLKYEIDVKNRFFTIIAHDLRGPFAVLLGMTEMMADFAESDSREELVKVAASVKRSGDTVYDLVNNLLDWSSVQMAGEKIEHERIVLRDIADENIAILAAQAKIKDISLVSKVADETAMADRNMVKTVVRNLVSNAIKFTPKHGRVEIISQMKDGMALVTVSDSGAGLSLEQALNLFDIDKKTTTTGTEGEIGSGLGLPTCKEMVEKNGGKIWVESTPGSGAKFHFTLPGESRA